MAIYFKACGASLRGRLIAQSLPHQLITEAKFTDIYDTVPTTKDGFRVKRLRAYLKKHDVRLDVIAVPGTTGKLVEIWHAYEDDPKKHGVELRKHRQRERRRVQAAIAEIVRGNALQSVVP